MRMCRATTTMQVYSSPYCCIARATMQDKISISSIKKSCMRLFSLPCRPFLRWNVRISRPCMFILMENWSTQARFHSVSTLGEDARSTLGVIFEFANRPNVENYQKHHPHYCPFCGGGGYFIWKKQTQKVKQLQILFGGLILCFSNVIALGELIPIYCIHIAWRYSCVISSPWRIKGESNPISTTSSNTNIMNLYCTAYTLL